MNQVNGFNQFGLHTDLLKALNELNFQKPTQIQQDAIPHAMKGSDVLACAMTGSGKTAAFVLPVLERLRGKPRGSTRALIVTPTRELAAQIVEHFAALAKHTRLRAAAVYGGVGMKPQEDALRRGVDVVVATPGRLLDHIRQGTTNFKALEVLVLDEADRMLDMGFLPDIRRIMQALPATPRQTLFFSATMPAPIVELSREILRTPVMLNVKRQSTPASGITQALYPVNGGLKTELLIELLRRDEIGNAIVFTRTKHRANRLFEKLERAGISANRIHGNRSQAQRTEALAGFKDGTYRVLVATDIVARGIDVTLLDHVINFDVPHTPEDYIHRIGRTARAEATGDAFTFVSHEEEKEIRDIEKVLGKKVERRKLKDFDYNATGQEKLEIPLAERIAAIRERKRGERVRAAERAANPLPKRGQPHRRRRGARAGGSRRRTA
ncbi:MAG TPA: DEAD/DEAH box helicase [Longimicrobiales bacterium]